MSTVNGFQVGSETLKYNYESLENYNTPNFSSSSSKAYAIGDYVMYNGKLYKCTTATTGGTWDANNWTEAVLSEDVAEQKNAISQKANLDAYPTNTVSGQVVIFQDGAADIPVEEIIIDIPVQQSGSGDPSASNKRPFIGHTGCNFYRSGADTTVYDTFPVSWEETIFGGSYNTKTGLKTKEWVCVAITSVASVGSSGGVYFTRYALTEDNIGINNTVSDITVYADSLQTDPNTAHTGTVLITSNGTVIQFRLADQTLTTKDAINAYLAVNPVTVCYKLKTPQIIQGTPLEATVKTLYGVNNVWSDLNGIRSMTYRADETLYDLWKNKWKSLNAVAFGTSLTYRAVSSGTGGYLRYLPALSGMTIENQGLGNSQILTDPNYPDMMGQITGYTEFADKDVVILEGFVNDWARESPLGTYTDTGTDTACGCVRYAIDYIYTQNANVTMFLVLDTYGRPGGSGSCASTQKNGDNLTQYQYYEEIAKVAESMGIHVIRLYAESGISERTPYYLIDNIHPSDLGARQTANTIWACMKKFVPNIESGE